MKDQPENVGYAIENGHGSFNVSTAVFIEMIESVRALSIYQASDRSGETSQNLVKLLNFKIG